MTFKELLKTNELIKKLESQVTITKTGDSRIDGHSYSRWTDHYKTKYGDKAIEFEGPMDGGYNFNKLSALFEIMNKASIDIGNYLSNFSVFNKIVDEVKDRGDRLGVEYTKEDVIKMLNQDAEIPSEMSPLLSIFKNENLFSSIPDVLYANDIYCLSGNSDKYVKESLVEKALSDSGIDISPENMKNLIVTCEKSVLPVLALNETEQLSYSGTTEYYYDEHNNSISVEEYDELTKEEQQNWFYDVSEDYDKTEIVKSGIKKGDRIIIEDKNTGKQAEFCLLNYEKTDLIDAQKRDFDSIFVTKQEYLEKYDASN